MQPKPYIEQWIRADIRNLTAYHVPNATGLIKLDAMENPHTWPDTMRQEWATLIQQVHVNRYPDPSATRLKSTLRTQMGIPSTADILLGNGSDELIQILALAVGSNTSVILAVEPSFVMYRMLADWARVRYIGIPLNPIDFSLDLATVLAAIAEYKPAVIFLAYPNNPTGNLFDADAIREIIRTTAGLVVIDEAYAPFTDATFLNEVLQYANVLVLRTLSKMGLAGLRLGYLVGHADWIIELDKVRMPYNINVLTQETAVFALQHKNLLDNQTHNICAERERLQHSLATLPGVLAYPSQANFILLRVAYATKIMQQLKDAGILIKCLHGSHPLLDNCLRITVGTAAENAILLTALTDIIHRLQL